MISRGVSIALLPFWRFDAKGGEVVLLGLVDLQGSGTSSSILVVFICLLVPFSSVNLFAICGCLCKTMSYSTVWYYVWYSWNSGFIYHGPHGILELWSIFDGIWIHGIIYVCLGYILIPVV